MIIRIAFWREDGDTLIARHHHDRVGVPFGDGAPFQTQDVHIPAGTAFRIGGPDGDMVDMLELDQCFWINASICQDKDTGIDLFIISVHFKGIGSSRKVSSLDQEPTRHPGNRKVNDLTSCICDSDADI